MAQVLTISFVLPGSANGSVNMNAVDGDPSLVESKIGSADADRGQYLARKYGLPQIAAEGVFDNAVSTTTSQLVDLTDLGVTFPATTMRRIRWRHWVQTDNDRYFTDSERWVLGGTTPVLLGNRVVTHAHGVIASTVTKYGRVHYKAAIASGATTESTTENDANIACGDFSSGVGTLTLPANRTATVRGVNFAAATYGASTGAVPHVVVTSGSTSGRVDLASPDDGAADTNPADGTLEIEFDLMPPGNADLVMNSNNVELQVTGIASDETRHRVEIFIDPPVLVPFQGS